MTETNDFRNTITITMLTLAAGMLGQSPLHAAQNWVSDTNNEKPKSALAALGEIDWDHWNNIQDLLTQIHAKTGIPAIAAVCVKDGKIVESAVVGVREFGKPATVAENDAFHLGSVTKSMTATVIGKLVEQGTLSWKTRVGDILTDINMRDEYRDVTIEDLLRHRAGLPSYTDGPPKGGKHGRDYHGSPTEIRAAFTSDLFKLDPVGSPGESFLYSNAGYAVAGYLAERATGKSWRQLVRKHVFDPLRMEAAGFGFPQYPAGHHGHGPEFFITRPDQYPKMEFIAPAGNVHCSIHDLARYAISHLNGLKGKEGYLRSKTIKRLHTPPTHNDGTRYAAGWRISEDSAGEEVHSHSGTVNSSYAEIKLFPESGLGIAILINVGSNVAEAVVNKIGRSILARYRNPTPDKVSFASADKSNIRFEVKHPGSSTSWKKAGGETSEANGLQVEMLDDATPEDETNFWNVIEKMAHAFNDEDLNAYMSLFTPANSIKGLDRKSMFEFMANGVMPRRGSVRSFHALSSPVKLPDSRYPVRIAIFHFENGYPGYLGLSLNEEGKIDHFSLFVKSDICPNGVDPLCNKIIKTISEEGTP